MIYYVAILWDPPVTDRWSAENQTKHSNDQRQGFEIMIFAMHAPNGFHA